MAEKKGVIGIVYDNNSALFFLIVHKNFPDSKAWEFVKGVVVGEQNTEDAIRAEINDTLGIKNYKIRKKLDTPMRLNYDGDVVVNDVFLVEASMNTPVRLDYNPNKLNTYLWGSQRSTLEKLRPEHKELLEHALPELQKLAGQ